MSSSNGLITVTVPPVRAASRVLASASPVMKTTGVNVPLLRSRSRSSGPLRPGKAHVDDQAIDGQPAASAASTASADSNGLHLVTEAAEEAGEPRARPFVVVDDRQAQRLVRTHMTADPINFLSKSV